MREFIRGFVICMAIFLLSWFIATFIPSAPDPAHVTLERYAYVHSEDAKQIGMIYRYAATGQCWLTTAEGVGEITCPEVR